MSAAVWCADLGLKPVLVERNSALGGQLLWTHNPITNYLGTEAPNGPELAAKFAEQVDRSSIHVVTGSEVTAVDLTLRSIVIDDATWSAMAVIIATGVRRRELGIPGEKEFRGRGILSSGAGQREVARNKTVIIVGGGDAAMENAVLLSEVARKVTVVHRRNELSARDEFVAQARGASNVEFVLDATISKIEGGETVEDVTLEKRGSEPERVAADAVLIRIGVEPNTQLFGDRLDLDRRGYIIVDKAFRTSLPGVWAIGDITSPHAMTIANAVGSGSVAAKSIASSLERGE